jgi:hypothetical protein
MRAGVARGVLPVLAACSGAPAPEADAAMDLRDLPTQALSEGRLARYRTFAPGPRGEPCAVSGAAALCIVPALGHETVGLTRGETRVELGSSAAFSVVAIGAWGDALGYALRYDRLPGQPVKLFVIDPAVLLDADRPPGEGVRVLTRGRIAADGPPDAETRAALAAETHPLDGQVGAACRLPVVDRDGRRMAYHLPCHVSADTLAGESTRALRGDGFAPRGLVLTVVSGR